MSATRKVKTNFLCQSLTHYNTSKPSRVKLAVFLSLPPKQDYKLQFCPSGWSLNWSRLHKRLFSCESYSINYSSLKPLSMLSSKHLRLTIRLLTFVREQDPLYKEKWEHRTSQFSYNLGDQFLHWTSGRSVEHQAVLEALSTKLRVYRHIFETCK